MTLVEVIASLALLATLLGGTVVAKGRLTRQWADARDRAEAVRLLDAQLQLWHTPPEGAVAAASSDAATRDTSGSMAAGLAYTRAPTHGQGELGPRFIWRASPLPVSETFGVTRGAGGGVEVVRYTAVRAGSAGETTLATIDLLRPAPRPAAGDDRLLMPSTARGPTR